MLIQIITNAVYILKNIANNIQNIFASQHIDKKYNSQEQRPVEKLFESLQKSNCLTNNTNTKSDLSKVEKTQSSDIQSVDKIFFQPNTIGIHEYIECVSNKSAEQSVKHRISVDCTQYTLLQIEKLTRYYEVNQSNLILRGLWFMNLIREVEINNKKIGIITIDESHVVTDIVPINIV